MSHYGPLTRLIKTFCGNGSLQVSGGGGVRLRGTKEQPKERGEGGVEVTLIFLKTVKNLLLDCNCFLFTVLLSQH